MVVMVVAVVVCSSPQEICLVDLRDGVFRGQGAWSDRVGVCLAAWRQ